MRIYIIRHADPDYANDTLTPNGHQEAEALAQYLQTQKIDEIYSSPLGRTQDTAQYAADLLCLPVSIEPWAQELETPWIKNLNRAFFPGVEAGVNSAFSSGYTTPEPPDSSLYDCEMQLIRQGSNDFMRRQGFLYQDGIYGVQQENRKGVAVFTHMGVGLIWLSHLLNIPLPMVWSGFFLHPASITTILMDERSPGFAIPRCIGLGDISHLCKDGLQPRPAGILANYQ